MMKYVGLEMSEYLDNPACSTISQEIYQIVWHRQMC